MKLNTNYYNYNNFLYKSNAAQSSNILDFMPSNNSSSINNLFTGNLNRPLTENVQNFISTAKVSAFNLQSALDSLAGNNKTGDSSFNARTAVSGNNNILTVKSVGLSKSAETLKTTVEVARTASAQINTGQSLSANASAINTGFSQGIQNIRLNTGEKSYAISFNISAGDTNKSVQQKIADSINSKNIDVRASVLYDEKENTSALVLESKSTGTDTDGSLKFTVSDFAGNGVGKTGIDNVSQYARNAVYSIDGGNAVISKTNEVNIGSGIDIVLKSEGTSTITAGKDSNAAIQDIRQMVSQFNKLLEASEKNKDDMRTNSLYRQLTDITRYNRNSLSRAGIDVTSDGYLKIDEANLKKAADNGSLERLFTSNSNQSYGFANRLSNIAGSVDKNTTRYATLSNSSFVVNPANININDIYFNSRQLNRYSGYENTGLLLSMMF